MAIRIGIVGMGLRGRQWVQVLRQMSGYEIAACVDVRAAALEQAAALGIPTRRCYGHLDEALDDARPEAIIVATSIHNHVAPSRIVLERRIPLLVEKPFALTLRDARGLVAMAEEAHVPLVVGQTYRYTGMAQTLRRVLRSAAIGRAGLMTYEVCRGHAHLRAAVEAVPNGILWETAVHYVDLFRYVLGEEVVEATAESFAVPWSTLGPGSSASVLLTFAGGTRAVFTATYDSRPASWLRVVAERGILLAWRRWLLLLGSGRIPRIVGTAPHLVPEAALVEQLARAVRTGKEPECSGRDNLHTVAVLEACARSAAQRRPINPQDLFDEPA